MGAYNTRSSVVPHIDLQSIGADVRIYGEIDDKSMRHFNPSIAWDGDNLKIAVRSCNFRVDKHGNWSLRDGSAYSKTDVLYGDLDPETLKVSNLTKLQFSKDTPTRTKVAGLEDVRLFKRRDGMHAIGFESDRVTKHLHNKTASMAEYLIKDGKLKYVRTLHKPYEDIVEKNWSPTDKPNKEFGYSYSPTQTYTYELGWPGPDLIGERYKGILHGGTQLLNPSSYRRLIFAYERLEMCLFIFSPIAQGSRRCCR